MPLSSPSARPRRRGRGHTAPAAFAQEQKRRRVSKRSSSRRARSRKTCRQTPIAITALTGAALEDRQVFTHRRARPGGAEPAVRQQRAARRQQLLFAGVHPRHRADRSDVHGRSRRRPLHRRCVHRQRRRRHRWRCATSPTCRCCAARREPCSAATRSAAPMLHHHDRSGRRIRWHGARGNRRPTASSTRSSRSTCRSRRRSRRAVSVGMRKQDGYVTRARRHRSRRHGHVHGAR